LRLTEQDLFRKKGRFYIAPFLLAGENIAPKAASENDKRQFTIEQRQFPRISAV
jgi:hypothetical protein